MAHKSVTIVQKAGEQINKIYLDILCKSYPLYMGMACMHDGKLAVARIKGAPTAEAFISMTKELGSNPIMFTVGQGDATTLEEDFQPFELLKDKDGNLTAVGCLTGDFSNHSVVKSSHTNEHHCVQNVLIPKLRKIYKSVGEGIPELIEELNDPVTKNDMAYWANFGDITILTPNGVVTLSAKNIRAGEFNWGRTSDALNYKEQTVAKVEAKELSMLDKLKLKMNGGTAAVAADLPLAPVTGSSAAAIEAAVSEDEYEIVCPKNIKDLDWNGMDNKVKIAWWTNQVGYKPDGYKQATTKVKRKKGTTIGVLAPLAATNVKDAATPISNDEIKAAAAKAVAAPQPDVTMVKDITPKHVSIDNLPILSPKQKMQLKTGIFNDPEVLKILGDDHKATLDPKLLKEFDDTFQIITEGLGFGEIENTMNWPFELILKMAIADPKASAIYAFNCRNEMYKAQVELRSIKANPANKLAKLAM